MSNIDFPLFGLLASVIVAGTSIWMKSEPGLGFATGLATGSFAAYQTKVKTDDTDSDYPQD